MAVKLTPLQVMQDAPVIPVIVLQEIAHAVPLARALLKGGIRMLEITLRTPAALACIEAISKEVPDAVCGAGTVRSAHDVRAALDAGAQFVVSPGYTREIGRACIDFGVPLLPGVQTASDILKAQEAGFTALKFFPAIPSGGVGMLKAWHGPFPDVQFCPTGGVSPSNAGELLAQRNVVCVGGSWLTPPEAMNAGDWERVAALAAAATRLR